MLYLYCILAGIVIHLLVLIDYEIRAMDAIRLLIVPTFVNLIVYLPAYFIITTRIDQQKDKYNFVCGVLVGSFVILESKTIYSSFLGLIHFARWPKSLD